MKKLNMQSLDVIGSNVEKIAHLFPNCVTERLNKEGKPELAIDFVKLQAELSNDILAEGEERYQFTWPDKRAAVRLANTPTTMTLRPWREESVDFDNTQNLYIEGDNLDVLKVLRETYLGKVMMIYIDPPYNTGNDFVYNDNFAHGKGEFEQKSGLFDEDGNQTIDPMQRNTESNGRFHTDWLNMIYPRIKIARDLLADDGVIFISIDDCEIENLKKICDEVFGSVSFVAQLVWEKKKKGSFLSKSITNIKEYILVYCKNKEHFQGLIGEINDAEETYPCINAINKRELRIIPAGIESKYRESNFFMSKGSEISDTTMSIVLHSDLVIQNGILAEELILEGNWRYSQSSMKEYALKKELYITRDLYLRRIVKETRYKTMKDLLPRVGEDSDISHTGTVDTKNLNSSGWGSNEDADEELRLLFGVQKLMDYPKPVRLILKLLASYRNSDKYTVLDFFSGSATTAHSVMMLNKVDGGKRKFIMVQLPEVCDSETEAYKAGYRNICEIGKERIRRAGKKVKEEAGLAGQNLDIGFRVLKLDSSNMADVYYTPQEMGQKTLFNENVKPDRSNEDLLFQVMLDLGIELSAKIEAKQIAGKTVHFVDGNYLVACFDSEVNETTIKEIAKLQPVYFVMRDAYAVTDSVIDNFEQIFKHYSPDTNCRIL